MHSYSYFITEIYYLHCQFYHIPTRMVILKWHAFSAETTVILIEASQVVPFKPIQTVQLIHVNNTMHDYTINNYCYCCHYFTVGSLPVISFIVTLIQSIIFSNSKVRAVVCLKWIQFHTIQPISYFPCTHIHTSSLTYISCIFDFIRLLLHFLLWSHTLFYWNNRLRKWGKPSCSV